MTLALIAVAKASPEMSSNGDDLVATATDFKLIDAETSMEVLSLVDLASTLSTLSSRAEAADSRLAVESSLLANLNQSFSTYRSNAEQACPNGEVAVGIMHNGSMICSTEVGSQVVTALTSMGSQLSGLNSTVTSTTASMGEALARTQSTLAETTDALNQTATLANASATRVASLEARMIYYTNTYLLNAVTPPDARANARCSNGQFPIKAIPSQFRRAGQAGMRQDRTLPSGGNAFSWFSSSYWDGFQIFDNIYGRWGQRGASYRGNTNYAETGGMEIRFQRPIKMHSFIVHCIRNTGSGLTDNRRGGVCYSSGSYDFVRGEVDYWSNAFGWTRAASLNTRNFGNWIGTPIMQPGENLAQNWRFRFPNPTHVSNPRAHIAEIEIYYCLA